MTTKEKDYPADYQEVKPSPDLCNVLAGHVMRALGQPADLFRIKVHHLWDKYYRANIFIGQDITTAKIANSFFLVADQEGNIISADPEIKRQY